MRERCAHASAHESFLYVVYANTCRTTKFAGRVYTRSVILLCVDVFSVKDYRNMSATPCRRLLLPSSLLLLITLTTATTSDAQYDKAFNDVQLPTGWLSFTLFYRRRRRLDDWTEIVRNTFFGIQLPYLTFWLLKQKKTVGIRLGFGCRRRAASSGSESLFYL